MQAEKLADSKGNGDHSSSGSGSECDGVILPGTTNEIESPTRKSLHIETPIEFFTASPPMGPLLIKPAEVMLFYTGADTPMALRARREIITLFWRSNFSDISGPPLQTNNIHSHTNGRSRYLVVAHAVAVMGRRTTDPKNRSSSFT